MPYGLYIVSYGLDFGFYRVNIAFYAGDIAIFVLDIVLFGGNVVMFKIDNNFYYNSFSKKIYLSPLFYSLKELFLDYQSYNF